MKSTPVVMVALVALAGTACGGAVAPADDGTAGAAASSTPPRAPRSATVPAPPAEDEGPSGPWAPDLPEPLPPEQAAPGEESWLWQFHRFTYDRAITDCDGSTRFIRYSHRYAAWVGAVLCSASRYKLFLGASPGSTFHEIGDLAGHGEDHCELVSPSFVIVDEDDVTSGGCSGCRVEAAPFESPGDAPIYARATLGSPFELRTSWPPFSLHTSRSYACGVTIP